MFLSLVLLGSVCFTNTAEYESSIGIVAMAASEFTDTPATVVNVRAQNDNNSPPRGDDRRDNTPFA